MERIGDSDGGRYDEHRAHDHASGRMDLFGPNAIRAVHRGDDCYRMYQGCVRYAVSRLISDEGGM